MSRSKEDLLKEELGTKQLTPYGRAGGGCISQGEGYLTDSGPVFVKYNSDQPKAMFIGECESLKKIYATNCIRVPKPLKVIDVPDGGAMFVAEYVDMYSLKGDQAASLGTSLARLHLHNGELLKEADERKSWVGSGRDDIDIEPVRQFGFDVSTCCGKIPLDNRWCSDWTTFYLRQRLQVQYELAMRSDGDRELQSLWAELMRAAPSCFRGLDNVEPSLLHGDLWNGNAAACSEGPIIFDPASFYGHSEFEFGIMTMFGGFGKRLEDAYHRLIERKPGFEKRLMLYQLFHYMNHWNHFGTSYRSQSISLIKKIIRAT